MNSILINGTLILFLVAFLAACNGGSTAGSGGGSLLSDINFPDSQLSQCIIDSGALTVEELMVLNCFYSPGVKDTTGLDKLISLTSLTLDSSIDTLLDLSANTF